MNYKEFLESKVAVAPQTGFDCGELNANMFPHQQDVTRWSLKGGRRAIFASFGNGKTVIGLELAHKCHEQTKKQSLIICPLGVRQEFKRDAVCIMGYSAPTYVRTQAEVEENADKEILITNYERVREGNIDPSHSDVLFLMRRAC